MIDINPMHWLGDAASEGVADGFTAMMMALWSAALWLLQVVFELLDQFTTPQLDDPGLSQLYGVTASLSAIVALCIAFVQLGVVAIRRDGRSMGTLVIGLLQYGAVLVVWIGVCAGLVLGAAGLSQALLVQLLDVNSFGGYAAGTGWVDQVSGTVESAVLGLCALLMLIPAAFGYLFIMLAREAALLVLAATMPIAAAGALSESTRAWMWKSIRWFLAACLTSPLLALVLGVGVQIGHAAFPESHAASGDRQVSVATYETQSSTVVTAKPGDDVPDTAANVGMAVVGCVVMLVGCFCPMALFRLLAFVDPGTGSGAAFRSAMSANGGIAGLLGPHRSDSSASTTAQTATSQGHSASEASAESATNSRFGSRIASQLPAVGHALGATMNAVGAVASRGAAMGVDVTSQAGVGHSGYYDTTPAQSGKPVKTRTGHPGIPDPPDGSSGITPSSHGAAHEPGAPTPVSGLAGAADEAAILA